MNWGGGGRAGLDFSRLTILEKQLASISSTDPLEEGTRNLHNQYFTQFLHENVHGCICEIY